MFKSGFEKIARCWKGYEPVPGKKPFEDGSCRPIKKKLEKTAVSAKWMNKRIASGLFERAGKKMSKTYRTLTAATSVANETALKHTLRNTKAITSRGLNRSNDGYFLDKVREIGKKYPKKSGGRDV
jgi:hypothetical protein